jgi:hypothetical protein
METKVSGLQLPIPQTRTDSARREDDTAVQRTCEANYMSKSEHVYPRKDTPTQCLYDGLGGVFPVGGDERTLQTIRPVDSPSSKNVYLETVEEGSHKDT